MVLAVYVAEDCIVRHQWEERHSWSYEYSIDAPIYRGIEGREVEVEWVEEHPHRSTGR